MAIDMHSHWFPPSLADALRARTGAPRLVADESGRDHLKLPRGSFPMPPHYSELDHRLKSMDECGISSCMFSLSSVFGIEQMPIDESRACARMFVDGASDAHRAHPDRIFALASLPIGDIELATAEFDRAMQLPGIVGAILPGDGFLSLEAAEAFRPLFEVAQKYQAHFLIHTGSLPGDTAAAADPFTDNERARRVTLDMQARISSNMITLCLTDFLQPYPDVTVQSHNLGGNIPFEIDRLDHISLDREPNGETPSSRFRNSTVMVDCNSMGPRSIERAVEVYGAHRILFGTDGTSFGANWSRKAIADARIPDEARRAILHGNAQAILGLH